MLRRRPKYRLRGDARVMGPRLRARRILDPLERQTMSLTAGTALGSYRVTALLGAGGMGEVYRAHDTKLGRDVAIKVLPASVAKDAKALSRFEREARAVAALSHPNIRGI